MPLVTVTGRVWDGSHTRFDPALQPRLWFKPRDAFVAAGLNAGVEVLADLDAATATFTAQLESEPGVWWVPVLDWLKPGQESEPPERRARGFEEWPAFLPGNGGDISYLFDNFVVGSIVAGLGAPPAGARGVAWFDLTDETSAGVMLYAPEGAI